MGFVSRICNLNEKIMRKIAENYPYFNLDWLITGEGDMIRSDYEETIKLSPKMFTGKDVRVIRNRLGITQLEFGKMLGVKDLTIRRWEGGDPVPLTKQNMLRQLDKKSREKLINIAKAPSESSLTQKNNRNLLPLISTSVLGKLSDGTIATENLANCEKYLIPCFNDSGAEYIIPMNGDSMSPLYPAGSLLAIRKNISKYNLQWGEAYVLNTIDGYMVRRLFPVEGDPDSVLCVSENKDLYPENKIEREKIRGYYIVVSCVIIM